MYHTFLDNLSSVALIQDVNHQFYASNKIAVEAFGFKSRDEMIGLTPYDMKCKAAERAHQHIKLDAKVLKTKNKVSAIIVDQYQDGMQIFLVEKRLIALPNNQDGVFIQGTSLISQQYSLYLANQIIRESKKFNSDDVYELKKTDFEFDLTDKEMECLFFLIRGITIKDIARKFDRSVRTIEGHINSIKYKMNCYSKNQIIEKAIEFGLLTIIPKSLLTSPKIIILPE